MNHEQQRAFAEAQARIKECRGSMFKRGDTVLDLCGLGLTALPKEIGQLTALRGLNLASNQLSALPKEIGQLTALTELNLSDNQLTTLPKEIGQLTALTRLDLFGNQLSALPKEIGQLTALTQLYLFDNQLTALPEEFGQLTALTELDLSHNQLTALLKEFGQLTALTGLVLSHNQLTALPEEFGQLAALTGIDLSDNQLTVLSACLRELSALERLFLHGSDALGLPPEVLGPTWSEVAAQQKAPASPRAILDYYFAKRSGARPLDEVKLVVVGRGGAGKSSLVERLVWDRFEKGKAETAGVALCDWPMEGCPAGGAVTAHVWDFAGQVITHSTHQFFFSVRALYVLVLTGRENSALRLR